MSIYQTNIRVANPRETSRESATVQALVDTGAELTWMPTDVLEPVGIARLKKRSFRTANGQIVQRDVGYAIVRSEGYETIDEVVLGNVATKCCWVCVRWRVLVSQSTQSGTGWSRRRRSQPQCDRSLQCTAWKTSRTVILLDPA